MLALALAAGAAAVSAGYQSIAPTGQWFGRAFHRSRRGTKQIALTFDDGPNDPHTLNLLAVLERHNVHATFFLLGRYVKQRPDLAREIARRGHIVGNHTFTHPFLTFQSAARIRKEIVECRDMLGETVGQHSNLFRPPWGARRPAVFRIVRGLGLQPVMWSVTGYDWNAPSADYIEQKLTSRIRGGDVILLHDGGHAQFGADRSGTVVVVDRVIRRYQAEGYEFVTIPSMLLNQASSTTAAR